MKRGGIEADNAENVGGTGDSTRISSRYTTGPMTGAMSDFFLNLISYLGASCC